MLQAIAQHCLQWKWPPCNDCSDHRSMGRIQAQLLHSSSWSCGEKAYTHEMECYEMALFERVLGSLATIGQEWNSGILQHLQRLSTACCIPGYCNIVHEFRRNVIMVNECLHLMSLSRLLTLDGPFRLSLSCFCRGAMHLTSFMHLLPSSAPRSSAEWSPWI